MSPRRLRAKRLAGLGLIAVALAGVPALAQLTLSKPTPTVYQVSLNVPGGAFSVSNLKPGDYIVRCVRVRNEGSTVARLTGALAVTGSLAPYMWAQVDTGSGLGNSGPSCAGFKPDGGHAFGTSQVVPVSSLTPEAINSWPAHAARSYEVILAMSPTAANAAQGTTATVAMVWHAAAPLVPKPATPRYAVNAKTGVITITFLSPAPGALTVNATMAHGKRYARKLSASTKTGKRLIKIKPTAAALKALRKAQAAHKAFKVNLVLVYTPTGTSPFTLRKTVTVVKARKR